MSLSNLVVSEMQRFTGKELSGKSRVMISCPWHKDNTPSLSVSLEGKHIGQYRCFACGASSKEKGGWNGLAKMLNLRTDDGTQPILENWTQKVNVQDFLLEMTWENLLEEWGVSATKPIPDGYVFRTIEHKILQRIKAERGLDNFGRKVTLFPIYYGDELVGGIKAMSFPKKGEKKYFNASGSWVMHYGLFPMHLKKQWPIVVLVEGPRDALWLLQNGIPALAILGSNSWTEKKQELLISLGVEHCFIAGDGDEAGRLMSDRIFTSMRGKIPRSRILIPNGDDPASISLKFWEKYRKFF